MAVGITTYRGGILIVQFPEMVNVMKKEYVIGLSLIFVIAVICGYVLWFQPSGSSPNGLTNESLQEKNQSTIGEVAGGSQSCKIEVTANKSNAPEKIEVYKTVQPKVTKTDAIAFAKKFNITEIGEINEGEPKISVSSKDMRYCLQLFKTGGLSYSDYYRSDTPNGIDIAENLPSDEEAIRIATSFLKERNLLPDGAKVGGVTHEKAYTTSNGMTWVSWEDILVYYTIELNGMKVEGTQFEIEIGGHGDVIRFFSNWKEYESVGEYPIKTRDSSIESLKEKGISTAAGPLKPDIVTINEIYLAYETNAVAYKEEYLEPVWVFRGEAVKNGTSLGPVKEFIPALTEESKKSLSSS
jgi:hypothetical protein